MNTPTTSDVTDNRIPVLSAPQCHVGGMACRGWRRVVCYFLICLDVAEQRRQLLALDERTLKDVGIARIDALREANRSFWDIPEGQKSNR